MVTDVERYSFQKDTWQMLPCKMNYPRSSCTPCEYHSVLYLVGGFTTQMESFSLKTFTFAVIWNRNDWYTLMPVAVPFDGKLYIISDGKCDVFDLKTKSYAARWRLADIIRNPFPAAVLNKTIISGRYGGFWTMSLEKPAEWTFWQK